MVRWIALESNFNLDLRPTIIYGRTLQSRQRGDTFFVESGRGKWLLWKVTEKSGKCLKNKSGKYLLWEVTVGRGVHLGCSVLKNRNVCHNSVIFMGNYSTGSDMIIKEKDEKKKCVFFYFYDFLVDFRQF